jgi:ankyrin repeat protein
MSRKKAMAKLLLEISRIEADLKDSKSQTPLLYTGENRNEPIFKLLLETSAADIESKDNKS